MLANLAISVWFRSTMSEKTRDIYSLSIVSPLLSFCFVLSNDRERALLKTKASS